MRLCKGTLMLAVLVVALGGSATAALGDAGVYPKGGGQFSGGAEGWIVTGAECNVPGLCTASGGYEGGAGSPPGSLAANTNISLNLAGLFRSTVTLQSPDFEVASSGSATLHLDRRFTQGSLVDLAPQLSYTATLLDRTTGKGSTAVSEDVSGDSDWSGKDGAATVKAGHTYALVLRVEISSTLAGAGLFSGSTSAGFDNVFLAAGSPEESGGGGSGTGRGRGGAESRLAALAPATLAGPATVKGKRLFVKTRCPAKIGSACRISVLGLLRKKSPATGKRTAKVAQGRGKRLALRVKPRAKNRLRARKRLLFKVRVRAGKASAITYKRLRLVRR